MKIAFYAPMKSPRHPRPSGDRRIARLLIRALDTAGHRVELMSELRAWEGRGEVRAQWEIRDRAAAIASELIAAINARPAAQKPELWFSYHLYHKAPDWIGPRVAGALGIPYVVAEASYAPSQASGPWSAGLEQVRHALTQAAAVICLNPRDIPALKSYLGGGERLHTLPPFIDLDEIRQARSAPHSAQPPYQLLPGLPCLVSIAMMRNDAKLQSYHRLAETMQQVTQPCQLLLIGDGRARDQVESLFRTISQPVHYAGLLGQAEALQALSNADLFAWPAVNEAIGMSVLEAQAMGLPTVVGDSGAIKTIVEHGQSGFVCPQGDSRGMAACIDKLLADPSMRRRFSRTAAEHVRQQHSLPAAASTLDQILHKLSR